MIPLCNVPWDSMYRKPRASGDDPMISNLKGKNYE